MNATEVEPQSSPLAQEIAKTVIAGLSSPLKANLDPDAKLQSLVTLLQEYTEKLHQYATGAGPLRSDRSGTGFKLFFPAARKLAQFVSQRLNRVSDDLLRMELELRLAEYRI